MSCNSVAMRVEAPPSRCRSDSISPRSATGPQGSEAGINGGAWQPHAGYPVSQASMGSASEGVWSHRQNDPAQEADALEPKGTGYGAGSRKSDRYALPHTPGGKHRPTDASHGNWERYNPVCPLRDETRSRCQPQGGRGGIPQEAKAEGNASDMLT